MIVQNIYKRVRWCYDEEALNAANLDDVSAYDFDNASTDNGLMNHIIKDKIGDALRWICLYAPAEQLSGGGSVEGSINIVVDATGNIPSNGKIALGTNFIRLIRVRCSNWHRAVMGDTLLKEDSEEYLQLMDSYGAEATVDRPQAALIESAEKKVEVWPHASGTYELTKLVMPTPEDLDNLDDDDNVNIPPLLVSSFLYYLAYLTLSAYDDTRAGRMLEIAIQHLAKTNDRQRA